MFSSECWCPVLLCSFAPLIHLLCELLHKPASPGWTHPPRDKLDQECRPGQAVPHAVLLQVPLAAQHRVIQRTARHRSNTRDVHPDTTVHTCSMCTWATLCKRRAADHRRKRWNAPGARSAQDLPRPLFSTDIDQNKIQLPGRLYVR